MICSIVTSNAFVYARAAKELWLETMYLAKLKG